MVASKRARARERAREGKGEKRSGSFLVPQPACSGEAAPLKPQGDRRSAARPARPLKTRRAQPRPGAPACRSLSPPLLLLFFFVPTAMVERCRSVTAGRRMAAGRAAAVKRNVACAAAASRNMTRVGGRRSGKLRCLKIQPNPNWNSVRTQHRRDAGRLGYCPPLDHARRVKSLLPRPCGAHPGPVRPPHATPRRQRKIGDAFRPKTKICRDTMYPSLTETCRSCAARRFPRKRASFYKIRHTVAATRTIQLSCTTQVQTMAPVRGKRGLRGHLHFPDTPCKKCS